jgi:hypothetical protein
MLSPFPVALRRTGVRFLGIPFAPGTWGLRYLRSTGGRACAEAEQSAKAGREG